MEQIELDLVPFPDLKFTTRQRVITEDFVTLDGKEYDAEDILSTLGNLDGTDYAGDRVVIRTHLRKFLERLNVVSTCIRGSSYESKRYDDFYEYYHNAYQEYCDKQKQKD